MRESFKYITHYSFHQDIPILYPVYAVLVDPTGAWRPPQAKYSKVKQKCQWYQGQEPVATTGAQSVDHCV